MKNYKQIQFYKYEQKTQSNKSISEIIKQLFKWTTTTKNTKTIQAFFIPPNKSLFTQGLHISQINQFQYKLEIFLSHRTETNNQVNNHIGYQYQRYFFDSHPYEFFQLLGYKMLHEYQEPQAIIFKSFKLGIEIFLYDKANYIKIIENSSIQINKINTLIPQIEQKLRKYLKLCPTQISFEQLKPKQLK